MELYYTICGFALGFCVMLLIHLNTKNKPSTKKEEPSAKEPEIHVPKYAAGSDIDNIRYHYQEPIKRDLSKSGLRVIGWIFKIIVYLVFFSVLFIYIAYKIDTI